MITMTRSSTKTRYVEPINCSLNFSDRVRSISRKHIGDRSQYLDLLLAIILIHPTIKRLVLGKVVQEVVNMLRPRIPSHR